MGASGSSRRLSYRNEDPRIIQVSDDVIRRLKSGSGQGQTYEAAEASKAERPAEVEQTQAASVPKGSVTPQQPVVLNIGSNGYPIIETVSAMQVRQMKNEELAQNDTFWSKKLKELETRYISSAAVAEEEFRKELEKLDKMIPKARSTGCKDYATKVSQCYAENTTQTLKCSEVVKEFAKCVEQQTFKTLAPSG